MFPVSTFLLISLRHSGQRGASQEILLAHLRTQRDESFTEPQLERELRALADQRLVAPYEQQILGKRWRITALGESTLQEAGL